MSQLHDKKLGFMTLPKAGGPEKNSVQAMGMTIALGCGVLAVLLFIILALQLRGIWLHYPFYSITGGENQVMYGIWKVQEGHPLYAWPYKDFFQLTLYNFASYHLYAKILLLFHVHGPQIMLYGRYLTVLFAACGAFIQTRLLCFLAAGSMSRAVKAAILVISFYTWFNSFFPGYYPISIRPDMVAVAVSLLGLYCLVRYTAGGRMGWVIAAGALWACAWCIKQADVAFIFGAWVYLVLCRKWRETMILTAVFWAPVGLVLLAGSPEYRWNILKAPTVNALSLKDGLREFLKGAALSSFSWTFAVFLPLYLSRMPRTGSESMLKTLGKRMCPGDPLAPIGLLASVVICGCVPSFIALCKKGSSLNQMLELFVAATTLSFILALRVAAILPGATARRLRLVVFFLLLSMCAFPLCQLAMHRIGPIVRATDADMARDEKFSLFLESLKKPIFIDDEIYSLPWYSTGNQYPAILLDHVFYDDAVNRGVISGGVRQLIQKHWFAALYLPPGSPFYNEAIGAQYRLQPVPPEASGYLDALGREHKNCLLLTLP